MSDLPKCPQCNSEYTYKDMAMYVCPECEHEWSVDRADADIEIESNVLDSNNNILADGDSISIIKDLKIKGTSSVIKVGTKVKNIRLVDGDHNIDCKVPGVGSMKLKSEFVKKI
jgi:protein PhnA